MIYSRKNRKQALESSEIQIDHTRTSMSRRKRNPAQKPNINPIAWADIPTLPVPPSFPPNRFPMKFAQSIPPLRMKKSSRMDQNWSGSTYKRPAICHSSDNIFTKFSNVCTKGNKNWQLENRAAKQINNIRIPSIHHFVEVLLIEMMRYK